VKLSGEGQDFINK